MDKEYFNELIDFYKNYFSNIDDLKKFFKNIFSFKYDKNTEINIPKIMLNNTIRLVKLSEDMEKIRPGQDALKIIYLVTCIETLYKLSNKTTDVNGKKLNKATTVIDFFETYISESDKEYILSKVKRSLADYSFRPEEAFEEKITIEIFARIINETRNVFMHEGDYWNYSLSSMDCTELKIINIEEAHCAGKNERVYEFDLKYDDFHVICVKGFIYFIEQYIKSNN